MKKVHKSSKNLLVGLLFAAPALLGLLILNIIPMIASLILSFTNYSGFNSPTFIGLLNYKKMFGGSAMSLS